MKLIRSLLPPPSSSPPQVPPVPTAATISRPSLAKQIDGLKVGRTVAGNVYLTHPAAKQVSLGCAARNKQNEIFALSASRKPPKEFFDLIASATALVFTIPKGDALRGAQRCANRIGFLRGKNIVTRYRKLDIRCTGTNEGTSVTVSRELDIKS